MSELEVHMFPCLQDNYGFLIHDQEAGLTAVIDTPDVPAINAALAERGWALTHILNTHHHFDHAGGNLEIKRATGCTIVGPKADAERIPGIDIQVGDGDVFQFGNRLAAVHDTPGHTRGHIVYHFADSRFALSVEPDNAALVARSAQVDQARAQGRPTVPTTLALEKATNPFLRPDSPGLQSTIGLPAGNLVEVFARTRELKDGFRG